MSVDENERTLAEENPLMVWGDRRPPRRRRRTFQHHSDQPAPLIWQFWPDIALLIVLGVVVVGFGIAILWGLGL